MVDEEMKEKKKAAGPGHQQIQLIPPIDSLIIHQLFSLISLLIPLMPQGPQQAQFIHSSH